MDFTITLERTNKTVYDFNGDQFKAIDDDENPTAILGKVFVDDDEIGKLLLYKLYNDADFLVQCDALHSDFAVIAVAICGKSGAVLKRYVPDGAEYQPIYILDNITIHKEYRGKGIGTSIVKNLLKMITYQFGDASVLFLCASDFESAKEYGFDSPEYLKGMRRLIQFYKRLGFRVVKDNIMVYCKTES